MKYWVLRYTHYLIHSHLTVTYQLYLHILYVFRERLVCLKPTTYET